MPAQSETSSDLATTIAEIERRDKSKRAISLKVTTTDKDGSTKHNTNERGGPIPRRMSQEIFFLNGLRSELIFTWHTDRTKHYMAYEAS